MKRKSIDTLIIGAALFAMFFGAGNLIFPPSIGLASGTKWFSSLIGFFLTGILVPILGVLSVSKAGGTINELGKKVSTPFSIFFGTIVVLAIGPLLAIPRTGATVYEIGVAPIFNVSALAIAILYYFITFLFVIKPNTIIDKLAKVLTPILLLVIGIILINGLIFPIGTPQSSTVQSPFSFGFLEGYQTMDALVSILMGGLILSALVQKGYSRKEEQMKLTTYAGMISGFLLALIYGGLLFLGASLNGSVANDITRTALILEITRSILGPNGLWVMSIAVSAACLTTSIGLTAVCGEFFSKVSNGKITYEWTVTLICIFSTFMSVFGVEKIVAIAVPLLALVYPIAIVLIVMNLIDQWLPNPKAYLGAVTGAGYFGLINAIELSGLTAMMPWLKPLVAFTNNLPLTNFGFGWLIPSLLLGILYTLIDLKKPLKPANQTQ